MKDISEKDAESLQEAEKTKEEAEQLQITANELYLDAAMLEQNENFATDKKIQKQYKKTQQNAQKTELHAADKFEEANKIKIEIYQKYVNDFWNNFEGDESVLINARLIEETSKEYFVRASTSRDEAKRIENQTEKFLKLSEAYEYELIGIEKLQTAYEIYKNWPDTTDSESEEDNINFQISDAYIDENFEEPETTTDTLIAEESLSEMQTNLYEDTEYTEPSDTEINYPSQQSTNKTEQVSTIDGNVQVNSGQVEKILRYMEEESDTIYYLANDVEGFDMSSIQKFWDSYRNIEYQDETEPPTLLTETTESKNETEEQNTNEILNPEFNNQSDATDQHQEISENLEGNEGQEIEIGKVTETVVPDPNSKIIYRIQIAAQKAPLSQAMLQKLFYANHKIAMVDEGGWFKYSIGEFDSFSDADEFRKTLNRDDAFVIAYRDAINVQYIEGGEVADKNKQTTTVKAIKRPELDPKEITFVVQIAASKSAMDETSLKRIYKGDLPIKQRNEDNWCKYQIGHTNSYLEIKNTKNDVNVNGAFIVAYNGDTKLKLWQAIRIVHSSDNQIMFVLQIAASITRLSDEKINSLFSGNDHVIEIYEDGWYKYHIVCGNTYDSARRFKNLWGIKNSFIVAYKNNKKIEIRQAIEETSN